MEKSITEICGSILAVSQFTLYAKTNKGNRPNFSSAAEYSHAKDLFEFAVSELKNKVPTESGVFGETMAVSLVNWGPLTIILDSEQ